MQDFDGVITWVYFDDLDKTSAFYGDVLGLALWRDAGSARIFRVGPAAMIGVCRAFADRVVQPAGGMITLLTDAVDETYARLLAEGAELEVPPERLERFGIYSFFCRDPNGYVIEVQSFLDP